MPVTFDGDNLLIILGTETSVDAKVDLYSDWKEWFKTGTNSKYPLAFDTTGGDPLAGVTTIAPYFFLRNDNGWRIRPPEQAIEIRIIGNLFRREPTFDMFLPTLGNFTVSLELEISPQALQLGQDALTLLVQQTLTAALLAASSAASADSSAQSADTAAQSADANAQAANATAQRAVDVVEADEILNPDEAVKLLRGTAHVLFTKVVTGGQLTIPMTLIEKKLALFGPEFSEDFD